MHSWVRRNKLEVWSLWLREYGGLAYVYESALIDRDTRSKLGTHSTPTWLVDYVVGRLRPWIEREIPVAERRVFEPACGHAGFLISAMRLLSELLPADWREPRRTYLAKAFVRHRERPLCPGNRPPFAHAGRCAQSERLGVDGSEYVRRRLSRTRRTRGDDCSWEPTIRELRRKGPSPGWLPNKAAETFRRVVENLPQGGVFGFVLPQTFLRSKQAVDVRDLLLRDYEIAEISLFATKCFAMGNRNLRCSSVGV